MWAIIQKAVFMSKLESRATMSAMDCNQRDLCMSTYH
jgi:hypothetical protein